MGMLVEPKKNTKQEENIAAINDASEATAELYETIATLTAKVDALEKAAAGGETK